MDFICDSTEEAERIVKIAKEVFTEYNLIINEEKTEIIQCKDESDLKK